MLFENVFQFLALSSGAGSSCDLMLFENVFQYRKSEPVASVVVI